MFVYVCERPQSSSSSDRPIDFVASPHLISTVGAKEHKSTHTYTHTYTHTNPRTYTHPNVSQAMEALGYLPSPDSSTPPTEYKDLVIFGHSFGAMVGLIYVYIHIHVYMCMYIYIIER